MARKNTNFKFPNTLDVPGDRETLSEKSSLSQHTDKEKLTLEVKPRDRMYSFSEKSTFSQYTSADRATLDVPSIPRDRIYSLLDPSSLSQYIAAEKAKVKTIETFSWKDAWVAFSEYTTFHGLRFIGMEEATMTRKLFWLMLVGICTTMLCYQMVDRIIYYYSHPITVSVNINFNKTLLFPALILCNQNRFRATQASKYHYYRLLETLYSRHSALNASELDKFNLSDLSIGDLFSRLAHSKYDLIVDCEWQNEECGPDNFTEIITDHGVCFTFNSDPMTHPLQVTSTGSDYGLRLTLNMEQYEYMPGPHSAAGAKILLHDGEEFPAVGELGLSIPTGFNAFVGIQVLQMNNLPKPDGECGAVSDVYYKEYSINNCYLSCLTELMSRECGCRDPYMPSYQGHPPVCTWKQYIDCFMKKIADLNNQVRHDCACPVPCSSLAFNPAISLAATSVFSTDRLLHAASRTSDLETRYLTALETKERMEDIRLERFLRLELEARDRLQNLTSLMLVDVRRSISEAEPAVSIITEDAYKTWETQDYLLRWQEYHVQKDFMRARDAMRERTFGYLVDGFQEYATLTESRILALTDPDISEPEVRKAIYTILLTSLKAKTDLCDRAYDNYTQLLWAYRTGNRIFHYQYLEEPKTDSVYLTPKSVFRKALNHSSYARIFSKRVGWDIKKYKSAVETFIKLATEAYNNHKLNKTDIYLADVEFLWRGRRFLYSMSQFEFESVDYPLRILQKQHDAFVELWKTYGSIAQDSLNNIDSLKTSLERLETSILAPLNHSMQKVREYFTNDSHTKLDIARELTSRHMHENISEMMVFFQSLRSRAQKIYDNWDRLAAAEIDIMRSILHNEDMVKYFEYKNMTEFLRDLANVSREIHMRYLEHKQMYDFRFLVGSSDSLFLISFENLIRHLENFLKKSDIGEDFIRENFLQLNVFYREKSYEQITQQKSYDTFALLCDIGGSLGLFVGASVMSLGEFLDLILIHVLFRLTNKQQRLHPAEPR